MALVNDFSQLKIQNSNCQDCSNEPYLLYKDSNEKFLSSLRQFPPKFLKKLELFSEFYLSRSSFNIICKNCEIDNISNLEEFNFHVKRLSHNAKISIENSKPLIAKITLCKFCYKIYFYNSTNEDDAFQEFPPDVQDNVLKRIFPLSKLGIHPFRVMYRPEKYKNITIYLIVSEFDKNLLFNYIYNELREAGEEYDLNLKYLCCADTPHGNVAYCVYYRKTYSNIKDKDIGKVMLNGCIVPYRIVSAAVFEAEILEMINHEYPHLDLLSEMFGNWKNTVTYIDDWLTKASKNSKDFNRDSSILEQDLLSDISDKFKVKSLDFIGSRFMGITVDNRYYDILISIDEKCTIQDVVKILRPHFTHIRYEKKNQIKVAQMRHNETQLKCVIFLNFRQGFIDSKLIKFYLEMDERVKWLVVAIKNWAYTCALNGFGNSSVIWLVLFTLMQEGVELVPPVSVLTTLPCRNDQNTIHYEETGFNCCLDMEELMKVHNPKMKCHFNEKQLLEHFFEFCQNMSLNKVLDPFTGHIIPRQELPKFARRRSFIRSLPNKNDRLSHSFIIIDPVNSNRNITFQMESWKLKSCIAMALRTSNALFGI